ncbi:MAG: hypothetical protein ABH888_01820 [Patescibacteria group bacterium]
MVTPYLTKKTENTLTLTDGVKRLFQVIYSNQNKVKKTENNDENKINVSEVISKMAFYYEKIRNSVDYKEENLLKKNAIERILKRQIVIEGVIKISQSETISKHLLIELIRAGYLPNNKIPEHKINEISIIIEKYIKLKNYSIAYLKTSEKFKNGHLIKTKEALEQKSYLTNRIIAVLASEIEEKLETETVKQAVVNSMHETLTKNIELPKKMDYKKDLDIQIYLGIYRNFTKSDQDMLSLILFKYFNANWIKPSDQDIQKIAKNIMPLFSSIDQQLDHPLSRQLDKIIKHYSVYFTILSDAINKNPAEAYDNIQNDLKAFSREIKKICADKYQYAKSRLWRAGIRSIIYIFLTKSIFVIILEVPAIKWFGQEINFMALGINIIFPAFLLFVIILFTNIPSDANTKKIIEGVEEITFQEHARQEPFVLRVASQKRGKFKNAVFGLIYAVTFFLSFGVVVWALNKINFNWVSAIIFLFFLALVSFFSIMIRKGTREFVVIEPKENIFSFLTRFFNTPIVATGKWLSEQISQLNVFIFILDFIIEAPFKIFVEITEEWTKYIKEREEEIR